MVDLGSAEVRRLLRAKPFEETDRVLRRARVDCLRLSTTESYERPLASFFKAREKRR